MSNYYSQEPPTTGKVILITNYGNIDIELWTKETPKTCKNFIQLCLENYYNNNIFFRIINKFMIQTGDKTNSGKSGSSIYNNLEFKDEIHSRLKFNHRGIVAMANKDKPNTNGSQFFITLDKCQEMDKKFTIFGKVTGPTFFNALNISNLSADEDGNPIMNDDEKPKILNTEVVINPFNDLKPTVTFENDNIDKEKNNKIKKKKKKLKIKYTSDKMFFKDEDNEEEKDKNEKEKNEVDENEFKEKKDNNDENNIHFFKEDDKNNKDKNEDDTDDKNFKNEQNAENEEKKDEIEEDSNEEKNKNEKVENADENDEESESKSLSSENHIVQNAKQILGDDEDNIPKKKRKILMIIKKK